jgi:basic amino acid/polyamine antiporter, APA family
MEKSDVQLKKALSGKSLFAIGVGCVVGWSWVIYGGMWSTMGGSLGGILAFVITGLLCTLVGLVYAELSSAYPKVGGDIVYALEGTGTRTSIAVSWMLIFFWIGLLMIETMFFPIILTRLGVPIPMWGELWSIGGNPVYVSYLLTSLIFNAFLAWMNSRSVEVSGKAQEWAVWIMLAAAFFLAISSLFLGDVKNMQPLFTDGQGFLAVFLMLPGFMSGFNAIPQAAEEAKVSPKIVGRAVVMTVWGAVLFYVMIIFGSSMGGDFALRSGEGLVVLDVIQGMYGGSWIANFFITLASLFGMLTTWNACYIAASRLFIGLGRAKYLPASMQEISPKTQAPTKAIWTLFAVSSLIVFVGCNRPIYILIIDVFSFYLVVSWVVLCINYLRIHKKNPGMNAPYKIKYPKLLGWSALVFCLAFLYLYMPWAPAPLTTMEWIVTIILAVIAVIIYFAYNKTKGALPIEERRKLLGIDQLNKN